MKKLYLAYLADVRDHHIETLQAMFGNRDDRFVVGGIGRSADRYARTFFPNGFGLKGNCVVDIHITQYPFDHCCYDQGAWQVAHECVHLLDPTINGASNFLEEGLACWYQNEPAFHNLIVRKYIKSNTKKPHPHYVEAKALVRELMPKGLAEAVCGIRNRSVRIGQICPDMLAEYFPRIDPAKLERLCQKFKIN